MDNGNPISAAASTSELIDSKSRQIAAAQNQQRDLYDIIATAQESMGVNSALVESTKATASLQTQQAAQKVGSVFGADMRQENERLSALAAESESAYKVKVDALRSIQEKDSVGFMDNPLQYILNQFSVNEDIARHNAADQLQSAASARINEITSQSSAAAQNQKNFEVSTTQAAIDAQAKNTLALAQVAANQAKSNAIGFNVDALKTAMAASKDQLTISFQVQAAKNEQSRIAMALESAARQREEFSWAKERKQAESLGDNYIADRIDKGLKLMYGDSYQGTLQKNPDLIKQYVSLLKSNSPAGQEASVAYMAGQTGVLGGNPSQVWGDIVGKGRNYSFTDAQKPLAAIFQKASDNVSLSVQGGSIDKSKSAETFNTEVRRLLGEQLKNIDPNDKKNLFNIPPVRALIDLPGVKESSFINQFVRPLANANALTEDRTKLFELAVSKIQSGEVKIDDAVAGIVALHQKGVSVAQAQLNLPKFGVVPDDLVKSYKTEVVVDPNSLFRRTKVINFVDPLEVKANILRSLNPTSVGVTPNFGGIYN